MNTPRTLENSSVTIVIAADRQAPMLAYTLRSALAQTGIGHPRIVIVATHEGIDSLGALGRLAHITIRHARPKDVRAVALAEAQRAMTPFVALTCGTDYWQAGDKIASQITALEGAPDAAASFHLVTMRWQDDLRLFPRHEWRKSGKVFPDDIIRAIPWTSLVARTGSLGTLGDADSRWDFFGARMALGQIGLAFSPGVMAIRHLTHHEGPLADSPLERLEGIHTMIMSQRDPRDHRFLGSGDVFTQDWLAAIESGLVLPAEAAATEWSRRMIQGELEQLRMALAEAEGQVRSLRTAYEALGTTSSPTARARTGEPIGVRLRSAMRRRARNNARPPGQ